MSAVNEKQWVLVWDLPVRVFHWLLVISFAGAWLTAESEAQQMLHYAFGYAACALVLFRIVWGIVGTRYALFTQFIKGPAETVRHIKSMLSGTDHLYLARNLGHNPAGALAMVTGQKQGSPSQAIRYPLNLIGITLALAWIYLFFLIVSGAIESLTR